MTDRAELLGRLVVGDMFHAQAPNGASLVCLVTTVSSDKIYAKRMTSLDNLEFDRQTGIESGPDSVASRIDSVTPVPVDIHNIWLGIERKFRLEHQPDRFKLNDDEIRAIKFINDHYPANPI
jgi:hypothetical protein